MTITYEVTQADHWALFRYLCMHDRKSGVAMLLAILALPGLICIPAFRMGLPLIVGVLCYAVALVIWSALLYGLIRFQAWRASKLWPPEFRLTEMTLADDGIQIVSKRASTRVDWSGIVRLARDRRAIYLFLSRRLAYVVPLRAFASSTDADAFVQFAQTHLEGKV